MPESTRKSPATILAEVIELLKLSKVPALDVEELRDLLISAFQNFMGIIFYSEVEEFTTGDKSLKSAATITLSDGHSICIRIAGNMHFYTLKYGTVNSDIEPYIIQPTDYDADINAKYWQKSGVWYKEITTQDLNNGEYVPKHNIGVMFPFPLVINGSNEVVPIVTTPDLNGEKNVLVNFINKENTKFKWSGAITGTYKLILLY